LITTFTRSQLRALQLRHLDDLLPLVPGLDVVDANWGGLILNQGLQNTMLFLSNGVPLVNGLNNFRALGRDFRASLVHVDRVELVRGPGAVVWGQNAFLGTINLITDIPTRRAPTLDGGVLAGTLRTEELWARGGQNRGLYAFTASVSAGRRVGPSSRVVDSPQAVVGVNPVPFGNGGTANPAPDDYLDVQLRVAIAEQLELAIQNLTSDYQFEISPFGPLLDRGQGGYWRKTHRLYSVVGTRELYQGDGARLVGRAQLSRYEYFSDENFAVQPLWPDGPAPAPGGRDLRNGLRSLQGNSDPRVSNQLDARVDHEVERAPWSNHLSVGLGLLLLQTPVSLATLAGIVEEPTVEVESFGARRFTTLSAYALDQMTIASGVVLSAGTRLRIDRPYEPGGDWRITPSFQGGVALKRGAFGAKAIYAEGFRPPDAVQLYSQVGTRGNPQLVPEYAREIAAEVAFAATPDVNVRAGGNLTRVTDRIVLRPVFGDPMFAQEPINSGKFDIASGYVAVDLVTSGAPSATTFDGLASYHTTALAEPDDAAPTPIARHTAALALVWRPLADLSMFVRGSFASPRRLRVLTNDNPEASLKTLPTLRSALGVTLTNVVVGADLEIAIDNQLLIERDAPYQLDGSVTRLVERRRGTELFATLRYQK
jgi:outer membrane receptor protein involved in Fe transport